MRWLPSAQHVNARSLPFLSYLSFDDLCRLISYIREFNEEWLRLFHAHTCARACVNGSANTLIFSVKTDPPQLGSLSDSV